MQVRLSLHFKFDRLRYFFDIAYKGTNYHGWQIQKNANSVQETIESKLEQLLGQACSITGSGRTDTGVHARKQVFHVDLDKALNYQDFAYHLNAVLPQDIVVRSIRPVHDEAHARFDADSRGYQYQIIKRKDPFLIGEAYMYSRELDIEKLNTAASHLVGKYDFEAFSKVKTSVNNFDCDVTKAVWYEQDGMVVFEVKANRFLRGMVRAIVGTLLLANEDRLKPEGIIEILESRDRKKAGRSVPAEGLFLTEVNYPERIFIS